MSDGSVRRYRAVVVAIGVFQCPKLPEYPGSFDGDVIQSHDYRIPEGFDGHRVLVVGAGQPAAEIAVEVSGLAAHTYISVRGGTHVIPRWIGRKPYDNLDGAVQSGVLAIDEPRFRLSRVQGVGKRAIIMAHACPPHPRGYPYRVL